MLDYKLRDTPTGINIILDNYYLAVVSNCCESVMKPLGNNMWCCSRCGDYPIQQPLRYVADLRIGCDIRDTDESSIGFWVHKWTRYPVEKIQVELG